MINTDQTNDTYEVDTIDDVLLIRLKSQAFRILTDPLSFDDFFSQIEGLKDPSNLRGYLQLNDIDYHGREAVRELVAQISKDEKGLFQIGRYVGLKQELIAARFRHSFGRYLLAVIGLGKPTVAAMRGNMSGEHLGSSLAFDMRIVTRDSTFAFDNVRTGLPASPALTHLMPRYIGIGRTMSLLQTGATIDAQEALSLGLVTRLVDEPDELTTEALGIMRTLQHLHPHVVAYQHEQLLPSTEEMQFALTNWYKAIERAVHYLMRTHNS